MTDFFEQRSVRDARRRERRRAVRRRRRIVLTVAHAAILAGAATVVLARGGDATPVDGGASAGEASTTTAPGAQAPAASPVAVAPTPAPLRKPTKKKQLRVYFGGDSLSGMPAVMFAQRAQRTGLMRVTIDYQTSSRLTVPEPIDWPARLRAQLSSRPYDVGVFLIGINDTGMPMIAGGRSTMYPSKAWLREYQDRVEKLMLLMLKRGVDRVYWAGLPVMPKYGQNEAVKALNKLFQAAAAGRSDVVYVDTYTPLATTSGEFDPAWRSGDGVHFTNEGAERIAAAVWAAMQKDWRTPKASSSPGVGQGSQ